MVILKLGTRGSDSCTWHRMGNHFSRAGKEVMGEGYPERDP